MSSEPDASPVSSGGRLLWRLYGPARVVIAALYPHEEGTELRVFFEPEQRHDLLSTQVGREIVVLEERAERLKVALQEQGWLELAQSAPAPASPRSSSRRMARGAAWVGALGFGAWLWSRVRRHRDNLAAHARTSADPPLEPPTTADQ